MEHFCSLTLLSNIVRGGIMTNCGCRFFYILQCQFVKDAGDMAFYGGFILQSFGFSPWFAISNTAVTLNSIQPTSIFLMSMDPNNDHTF
jgi:hypothetical protein